LLCPASTRARWHGKWWLFWWLFLSYSCVHLDDECGGDIDDVLQLRNEKRRGATAPRPDCALEPESAKERVWRDVVVFIGPLCTSDAVPSRFEVIPLAR
jgi:hypothetical protein